MKVLKAALAALPLMASLLLLPVGANAATSSSGSGSFTATGEVISVHQADGNTIVTATEVQTLTGALTGTRVASGTMTFHPDGTFTAHDTGTFTAPSTAGPAASPSAAPAPAPTTPAPARSWATMAPAA